MAQEIKHRRLYAFFQSSVLNALMIIIFLSLLHIGYIDSILLPLACASTAVALFIAYSLWLWIKKPSRILIDRRVSSLGTWLFLYYLIAINFDNLHSVAWCLIADIYAIAIVFIALAFPKSETFEI